MAGGDSWLSSLDPTPRPGLPVLWEAGLPSVRAPLSLDVSLLLALRPSQRQLPLMDRPRVSAAPRPWFAAFRPKVIIHPVIAEALHNFLFLGGHKFHISFERNTLCHRPGGVCARICHHLACPRLVPAAAQGSGHGGCTNPSPWGAGASRRCAASRKFSAHAFCETPTLCNSSCSEEALPPPPWFAEPPFSPGAAAEHRGLALALGAHTLRVPCCSSPAAHGAGSGCLLGCPPPIAPASEEDPGAFAQASAEPVDAIFGLSGRSGCQASLQRAVRLCASGWVNPVLGHRTKHWSPSAQGARAHPCPGCSAVSGAHHSITPRLQPVVPSFWGWGQATGGFLVPDVSPR